MIVFLLHILGYDIWFYISHLLLHTPLLWKYHKLHHTILNPLYTDTYTGHFLEGPFQSVGFALPYLFYNFNWISFLCALLFVNIRGLMRHDHRIIWLIGNHHILHHQFCNYNFGEYWIDWLFNTGYKRKENIQHGLIYM